MPSSIIPFMIPSRSSGFFSFLSLIGAATLASLQPLCAEVPTEKVLPPQVQTASVAAHFQNEHYGFVITNKGVLWSLHNPNGDLYFKSVGNWILQGTTIKPDNTSEFSYRGGAADFPDSEVLRTYGPDGTSVFEIPKVVSDRTPLTWSVKVTCKEREVELEYVFRLTGEFTGGNQTTKLILPVAGNKDFLMEEPKTGERPMIFSYPTGQVALNFGDEVEFYKPGGITPSGAGVSFWPFDDARKPGSEYKLKFSLVFP
jgi:hypothetical protein